MNIILLVGKAGTGKNEIAKLLKDELPKTVITSFSKYIKLFALEYTNWDGRDLTKPRTFLQEMGDKIRAIDSDFLINRLIEDLKIYELDYDNVIISDVRLIREITKFKELNNHNVIVIKVEKPSTKVLTSTEQNHLTETELDNYTNYDYVIKDNNINEILKGIK